MLAILLYKQIYRTGDFLFSADPPCSQVIPCLRDELCPDEQYEVAVAEQADGHSQSQHQHAAQPQYQREVQPQHQHEVLPQRQHADHPPRIPQLDGFIDQQQCMLTLNSFSRAEERKKEREDDMENFKRMMQSKFGF